ncbi:MAG TPA: hypothetical protein V6C69_04765 [Trichormus sp.]|jgi:hypothetical protein
MGTARWNPDDWDNYARTAAGKSAAELFKSSKMHADFDPKNIKFRESCDSEFNPFSTPIIVAIDNTGSMGMLSEELIRNGLGVLMEEVYDRKPVSDPHLMCMSVGDAWFDRAPLQVTQFEADLRLADQLGKFWIEGGGGGNSFESYNLPWYFAATRTKCDAFLKRNKKGYLFTVGDEPPPPKLLASHANTFLGDSLQKDLTSREILTMASRTWKIFHIMIEEGSHYRRQPTETKQAWQALLGQHAIALGDHKNLSELVVSIMEVDEGAEVAAVADSWKGSTALTVKKSLSGLTATRKPSGGSGVTLL